MSSDSDEPEERRCTGCLDKVTHVAHRMDTHEAKTDDRFERMAQRLEALTNHLEARVEHAEETLGARISTLEKSQVNINNVFATHMDKEEKAFENFYRKLSQVGDKITELVVKAMAERHDIRQQIAADKLTMDKYLADNYISLRTTLLIISAAGIVISASFWFFTNVMTDNVKDSHTSEMATMLNTLTKEIHQHNGVHSNGGTTNTRTLGGK